MRYVNYAVTVFSVLLLTGCAVSNPYQEPSANQPHATIRGLDDSRVLSGKRKEVYIEAIDNKNIGMVWAVDSKVRLNPGPHTVKAYVLFLQVGLLSSQSQTASLNLHWNALAGQHYTFGTTIQGETISAWVVDSRGQAVSAKATASHLPAGATLVNVPELKRD